MSELTTIQKFEVILEKTNSTVDKINTSYNNFNPIINYTVDKISETVIQIKEIEQSIELLDAQVELICKEYDVRIEKCRNSVIIIQSVINQISNSNTKILENVLAMDSYSSDINYINSRSELIRLLKNNSDIIASMFIKFLSI